MKTPDDVIEASKQSNQSIPDTQTSSLTAALPGVGTFEMSFSQSTSWRKGAKEVSDRTDIDFRFHQDGGSPQVPAGNLRSYVIVKMENENFFGRRTPYKFSENENNPELQEAQNLNGKTLKADSGRFEGWRPDVEGSTETKPFYGEVGMAGEHLEQDGVGGYHDTPQGQIDLWVTNKKQREVSQYDENLLRQYLEQNQNDPLYNDLQDRLTGQHYNYQVVMFDTRYADPNSDKYVDPQNAQALIAQGCLPGVGKPIATAEFQLNFHQVESGSNILEVVGEPTLTACQGLGPADQQYVTKATLALFDAQVNNTWQNVWQEPGLAPELPGEALEIGGGVVDLPEDLNLGETSTSQELGPPKKMSTAEQMKADAEEMKKKKAARLNANDAGTVSKVGQAYHSGDGQHPGKQEKSKGCVIS